MPKDSRVLCFQHYVNESNGWGEKYRHLRLCIWYGTPERYATLARYYVDSEEQAAFTQQLSALLKEQRGSDEYFPGHHDGVEFKFQAGGSDTLDLDNWYGGDVSFDLCDSAIEVFAKVQRIAKAADLRLHRYVDDLPQKLIAALLKAGAVPIRDFELSQRRNERIRDRSYSVCDALPTTAQRQERERLLAEAEERRIAHEQAQEPVCA